MALTTARGFIFMILLGILASSQATCRTLHEASSMLERQEQWMALYGRSYKDSTEKEMRFLIFRSNVEYMEAFNSAGNRPYKLRVNLFADQSNEEFQASHNGYKKSSNPTSSPVIGFRYENVTAVPSSIDWRKKGAVTPIKDQGTCGNYIQF